MRVSTIVAVFAAAANAAYPGDIVQYWVDQSAILVNGTVINGLQSPPSGWFEAIIQASVYVAALESRRESLGFQQLAVSHAAHDALIWTFHGSRLYATIDTKLRAVLGPIGLDPKSNDAKRATKIGRNAAKKVVTARADDGINNFVDYTPLPAYPGNYQATPNGQPVPDTPQAEFIRLFGGLGDVRKYRAPAPPSVNSSRYEAYVLQVKTQGSRISIVRKPYDTETAYYWRESSPIGWNRFANLVIGNKLANDVVASAKFYAQLNYALANAGIASWDSKYHWGSWRPVTAVRRPGVWLKSGKDISDPAWEPLLIPTPNHQDYLSTHATFGAAAGAVIRAWNKGDKVDVYLSSNVTLDNVGVITRRITSIKQAVQDNSDSRVFSSIHFKYATEEGNQIRDWVERETLAKFDRNWDKF